jgi:hypothetical protein
MQSIATNVCFIIYESTQLHVAAISNPSSGCTAFLLQHGSHVSLVATDNKKRSGMSNIKEHVMLETKQCVRGKY